MKKQTNKQTEPNQTKKKMDAKNENMRRSSFEDPAENTLGHIICCR